jgi:hypothetical protein
MQAASPALGDVFSAVGVAWLRADRWEGGKKARR